MKLPHFFITLSLASIIAVTQVWANEGTQADLAKQAQNPVANMISVPFENSTNYGIGPGVEFQDFDGPHGEDVGLDARYVGRYHRHHSL
jgi:hypothetical protein